MKTPDPTDAEKAQRWLRCFHPRPEARLRLFCFPYAGRGASLFRTWAEHVPPDIEVVALQPPGREDRFREAALRRMAPLVDAIAGVIEPWCDRPFAYFGHSMGALIAFELARFRRRGGRPMPEWLFVSGRRAPQIPDPEPPIPELPDEEFARELQRRYQGIPAPIADDPELRALFLPMVKADLELVDTYVCEPEPPLDVPISVFGGTDDAITPEELQAWQVHTTARCRVRMLPGDHFFINTGAEGILRKVVEDLRGVVETS